MIVAFGPQLIANFHDKPQSLWDAEHTLRKVQRRSEKPRDVLRHMLPPLELTVLRAESL